MFIKKLKDKLDVKRYVISQDTLEKNGWFNSGVGNKENPITYVTGKNTEPQKKYFSLFSTVMGGGKLPKYRAETGIIAILYFLEKYKKIYLHNFDLLNNLCIGKYNH